MPEQDNQTGTLGFKDFSAQIKQQYPAYADKDDKELATAMLEKYPMYKGRVTFDEPKSEGEGGGFWSNLPKAGADVLAGIGAGVLHTGFSAGKLIGLDATKNPYMQGLMTPPESTAGRIGFGAEQVGEFFAPVPGVGKIEAARLAAKSPFLRAILGAGREFAQGTAIGSLQAGSLKEGVETGATAAPFGAAGEVAGKLAKPLRESAEKTYARVLSPTTKPNKYLTNKILSEDNRLGYNLLDKRMMAATEKGLQSKLAGKAEQAGQALEQAYNTLGPQAKVKVLPILDNIQRITDERALIPIDIGQQHWLKPFHTINSKPANVGNPELYAASQAVQMRIINELAPKLDTASLNSVRKLRQILDKPLSQKALFSGKEAVTVTDQMEKAAADSIREQIAVDHPDIAKINAEFSFWQSAKDVMGAAIQRKTGQEGLIKRVLPRMAGTLAGGAVGYREGGIEKAVEDAVLVGAGYELISHVFSSPAWRTVSAVGKNEVARMLASGRGEAAAKLAGRLVASQQTK